MSTTLVALGYQENWSQILASAFMRNALIGGTIVALAAGLIGYFVVVRSTAFAAHALAHIGLPGATGAVLVGVPVVFGLGVFCIGGALVIGALGRRAADREVATGTVLAMATGLGLFFNSLATKSSSTMTNVLFGNLLAITHGQLLTFAVLLAVLAACIGVIYRPLLFSSVNPQVAEAKGVPVRGTVGAVHGAAGTVGDDGGAGRRHAAAVRADRHPGRDRHHADPAAEHGDAHRDGDQRVFRVAGAGRFGDVQHAAQLRHRHDRLRGLGGSLGSPARFTTGGPACNGGLNAPSAILGLVIHYPHRACRGVPRRGGVRRWPRSPPSSRFRGPPSPTPTTGRTNCRRICATAYWPRPSGWAIRVPTLSRARCAPAGPAPSG